MKKCFVIATALSLAVSPALSQSAPGTTPDSLQSRTPDSLQRTPRTALPGGALPVGAATNFVFLAPVIGGLLAIGAIAGGGGTNGTTSTVSTSN